MITVFSAPNYCGTYNNKGAVLVLKDDTLNLRAFKAVDAPYTLPDDLNIFSWSLPFVTEKVMAIFTHLVSMCSKQELKRGDTTEALQIKDGLEEAVDEEQKRLAILGKL